ncbi:hypothetical protein [Methylobacterium segetis]|uniref:hypothetical protein n=1 Tax=Methylobacterium segetis TaxID=2488750 RepID=UPI00140459EC|nr:hypothetical protein [Methylobacterium segetis]
MRPILASLLLLAAAAIPARAEVKEYQIRRMLMLRTECQVSGLDSEQRGTVSRFRAECENLSHYPDGVEILCPDTEDERDCRIATAKRDFPHLRALQR